MPLIAKGKSSQSSFTPVPPGMHLARCFRIVDLGTQTTVWQGKEKHLPKVLIQFEIHSEDGEGNPLLTAAGEPLSISKRDRKSTRLNSSHSQQSRMPSSA